MQILRKPNYFHAVVQVAPATDAEVRRLIDAAFGSDGLSHSTDETTYDVALVVVELCGTKIPRKTSAAWCCYPASTSLQKLVTGNTCDPDDAGVREDNMDRQPVVAHLVVVGVPIFGTYEQRR